MSHSFIGQWITTKEFSNLPPINVFHRQYSPISLSPDNHQNSHVLFRKTFSCTSIKESAKIYISADDYYKLYINGVFVSQGPAPSYHFQYNYNVIDISDYLVQGKNTLAVHTYYQGLINRVWQSGDQRHGLILDLLVDDQIIIASDESFKIAYHSGYTATGMCGYDTQFLELYDSNAPEVGFETINYDDSTWEYATANHLDDHILVPQKSGMLEFERIDPISVTYAHNTVRYDFGSNYVGYLQLTASGNRGDRIVIRCAQELDDDGNPRYHLRANCTYEEQWILTNNLNYLDWFDYKSFRYAELCVPDGVVIESAHLMARHYPFSLKATLNPDFAMNDELKKIWNLCVHTQKYGVQEQILDCMEREKGFYLGDGCYSSLTNMILTHDDSVVRKLIDDAFSSNFISDTLMTCMNCSFMQEIAEYPLILVFLVFWHYNFTGDIEYLRTNYQKVCDLLDAYCNKYEEDGLLRNIDKWCVVEWPKNYQHNYDVDITEGSVCTQAHISINSYYLAAVQIANKIAQVLDLSEYRNITPLLEIFHSTFFDSKSSLFKDGEFTDHISLVGNSFVYGFGLCKDQKFEQNFIELLNTHGIHSLSFFCTFPVLLRFAIDGKKDIIKTMLLNDGAWLRMLIEDATTTFEGWGKDTKWNTSLFHMTMTYAAIFMADIDLTHLFGNP